MGRLDKDTTGTILLTSDGRLPNAVLRAANKQPKVYEVEVDRAVSIEDVRKLEAGVVITTVAQRDRKAKPLTAPTLPCKVRAFYRISHAHNVHESGIRAYNKDLYQYSTWQPLR